MRALIVLVVLTHAARAHADDQTRLDRTTAPLVSIGATAGMLGVAELIGTDGPGARGWTANVIGVTGLIAAPSAGDWYLGNASRAVKLTTIRAVGFASVVGGLVLVDRSSDDWRFGAGLASIAVGGATYCVAAGYSLVPRRPLAARPSLSVTPIRTRDVVGLTITGVF